MTPKKSQSAMEYLMTYGWAILIIAVVLGVLFQLGVFSGSALTPKAQPGSCSVQRLLGQVSLEGQCTGLLPQFVAYFNSQNGNIVIPEISLYAITGPITETAWVNFQSDGSGNIGIVAPYANTYPTLFLQGGPQVVIFAVCNPGCTIQYNDNSNVKPTLNKWYFLVGTYNSTTGNAIIYVNGTAISGQTPAPPGTVQGQDGDGFEFGGWQGQGTYTADQMANVQIYNTSLSASEVKALYLEGIGGVPIRLQNLVGWWPLNGNAQDYSGYNNNGKIAGGVSFNSTWQNTYTPP